MIRVEVKPELLRWARERAGCEPAALARRFPQLDAWERGEAHPTLKQLESFAKVTHAPVGFLFLPAPPIEEVPIPDFRTIGNEHIERPSPDLLDTIYICQQRQEWYREFARSEGEDARQFVGSASLESDAEMTAASIREALRFDLEERRHAPSWTEALRRFISVEKVGDEVQAVADELSEWAEERGTEFFLRPDAAVFPALAAVSAWAGGQRYEPSAVNTFLQVADYYLVAHARAGGHTVVTHEIPSASTRRIKIDPHPNGLENFWSVLKRAIKGTYVSVEAVPSASLPG
jgi:hypothetical protein